MPTHSDMIHQPKFWKTFLIFLVPLIVTNILQNLSGTINTIYVGQMLGVDAIAVGQFVECITLSLKQCPGGF